MQLSAVNKEFKDLIFDEECDIQIWKPLYEKDFPDIEKKEDITYRELFKNKFKPTITNEQPISYVDSLNETYISFFTMAVACPMALSFGLILIAICETGLGSKESTFLLPAIILLPITLSLGIVAGVISAAFSLLALTSMILTYPVAYALDSYDYQSTSLSF
jgi:hypothetical protein